MKERKVSKGMINCIIAAAIVVGVIVLPLWLQNPNTQTAISHYVCGLKQTEYTEAFIGIWGGIIGSFLGVLSAVWVQKWSENTQKRIQNRKFATIIFYDIDLFYREVNPLAVKVLADKPMIDTEEFNKIRRDVLIVEDWIGAVAEMTGVFSKDDWISEMYLFYGTLNNLRALLLSDIEFDVKYQKVKVLLEQIGKIDSNGKYVPLEESDTNAIDEPTGDKKIAIAGVRRGLKDYVVPARRFSAF